MRTRKGFIAFLLAIWLLPGVAGIASAQEGGWSNLAPGIDYQEYRLNGPVKAYVARMEITNPNVFIDSAVGSGELENGRETVADMAARYDEAVNTWGDAPGGRNRVVVAINGDYFNPANGYPENGQIQSNWFIKRYNDGEGWSGFVWLNEREPFIGQCVAQPPAKQTVYFPETGNSLRIEGINSSRGTRGINLYTYQYASTTQTDDSGVEVVVEVQRPLAVIPKPRWAGGIVAEIRDHQGSTPLEFDRVVLSGVGDVRDQLLANTRVGAEVQITQEIASYDSDCKTSLGKDFSNAYAAIGGAVTFLREGEPQHSKEIGAVARNPRTAIVYNDQYVYYVVVDGRQPGVSIGMSLDELAAFARDTLGASWGVAQDGGGSSTMVVNGSVVNTPSDLCYKPVAQEPTPAPPPIPAELPPATPSTGPPISNPIFLPLIVTSPTIADQDSQPEPDTRHLQSGLSHCERPVANGMLMVVYQPPVQSQAFFPGDSILTLEQTEMRLGPGTNFAILSGVSGHSHGTVLHTPTGLDGIFAKGSFWWKVAMNGETGWVPETSIIHPEALLPDLPTDR